MHIPPFDEKELCVTAEEVFPYGVPGPTPIYDFPVTPREAVQLLYQGKPPWQIMTNMGIEYMTFMPAVIPDNQARAMVIDATATLEDNTTGGKDMFGVEWEYVPVAMGSMVKPGAPLISDASEFAQKIVWPDVDSWDWEGNSAANRELLAANSSKMISMLFFNGFFERLISLMDFEGAIMALVDEEQKEYVKEFLEKLTDTYIKIFDKLFACYPEIGAYCVHDDWGSQQTSFFSPAVAEEMLVPHMKKLVDHLHAHGKIADLHSCGNTINQVPNFITAGWDSWSPQEMNDTAAIYELYGNEILISVMPEAFDPEVTSDEDQRANARAFAEQFCKKDKPSALNMYAIASAKFTPMVTTVWREELYRCSRVVYGE